VAGFERPLTTVVAVAKTLPGAKKHLAAVNLIGCMSEKGHWGLIPA
jgi:hypothetical protein